MYQYNNINTELGFLIIPSSFNATERQERKFQCQHSSADTVVWRLNGTRLAEYYPPNVTTLARSPESTENSTVTTFVHTLTIEAVRLYNQTIVQCEAIYFSQPHLNEISPPALSLLQGTLTANINTKPFTNLLYYKLYHYFIRII